RVVLPVGRSLLDPIQYFLIIRRSFSKAHAATMLHGRGRLEQQQTLFGLFQIDARLSGFGLFGREYLINPALDDPSEILAGIQGAHRELKAVLALDAPVAIHRVATPLGEDSADVAGKAEERRFLRRLYAEVRLGRLLSHFGF